MIGAADTWWKSRQQEMGEWKESMQYGQGVRTFSGLRQGFVCDKDVRLIVRANPLSLGTLPSVAR